MCVCVCALYCLFRPFFLPSFFSLENIEFVRLFCHSSTLDGAAPRGGHPRGRGRGQRPPVLVLEVLLDGLGQDEGVDLALGDALLGQVLADHPAAELHERQGLGCGKEIILSTILPIVFTQIY